METFVDFLNKILGQYVPRVVQIAGEDVALHGMAGMDWPYIVRAVTFLIVVYCLFKLVGGIVWKT